MNADDDLGGDDRRDYEVDPHPKGGLCTGPASPTCAPKVLANRDDLRLLANK